jgi:glyoxylase-like metal-dependent hydrolase (beta-lactamase superfamily II)
MRSPTRTKKLLAAAIATVTALTATVAIAGAIGWRATTHEVTPATLGTARSSAELEAVLDQPGPVEVETLVGADWEVDRSGLINLSHPTAEHEGLKDGPEPIEIYLHVLRHPQHGTFLIDTGVEHALVDGPDGSALRGPVASVMHVEKMHVKNDTASVIAREKAPLAGVFFTHLHLDHVSGMPDVPRGTPLFIGPGEAEARAGLNFFVQPVVDRELEGHAALGTWQFEPDADGRFAGVLDVFGDATVWALWVPGHTPGSTAYLARTPSGPVLFVGDTSHTAWGWEHDVEPGAFTADQAQNAKSLHALRELESRHPGLDVRLGHQSLGAAHGDAAPRASR